ncbi:MAG: Protein translocase subunit SecA [candidate division TM6 bacterium GW2011_GWF2_36_6]|nr:MAG: Protein translocase subunit SecA [candidate division TM6 bacterium GW2011_GWF2_36_6]
MITSVLAKIFGTKNDRELKRIQPMVARINLLEPRIKTLSDAELAAQTNVFRERISRGESLDSILFEAFAVVREAGLRFRNERHYDVQLIGGIVLHQGKIAEMKTGEGKTLVATLPLYLNALSGKGAHLITVNDYLARRDAEWMGLIYNNLGLSVGVLQNNMDDAERKMVYAADITYGTNSEFGFDYLRDNMKFDKDELVQRDLNFCIVDEVDSILIDEARTPLIISGPSDKGSDLYQTADKAVSHFTKEDYDLDEKARSVHLSETGNDKIEAFFKIDNLYAPENILILHHVSQALRAHALFKLDVDYVVRDGELLIVDEFTGRILPGRRYSDGLHQALEAKEKVKVERENQTLASITLQNYFRMYNKLAGMTGTAQTEAAEFWSIYKLDVVSIPTNRPMIRNDQPDIVFLTRKDKFDAVAQDIKECNAKGQPVLVGTISIETSEYLSYLLTQRGIKHSVLNAKQHEREAEIVKEAGEKGRVTIATNMAGRGTDIKLAEGVREIGGLRIIGTERHESRRIDNQLRGRAGRQGDPGSSKFYLSLEDDLMRIFGGERLKKTMERMGMQPGESIEHRMISRSIEKAQERVEKNNFDIRKHLIEYDDVLNQQRKIIYQYRRDILDGGELVVDLIREMATDVVHKLFEIYCPAQGCDIDGRKSVIEYLQKVTGMPHEIFQRMDKTSSTTDFEAGVAEFLVYQYGQIRAAMANKMPDEPDFVDRAEKWVLLETIDHSWRLHLLNIDHLKEGIGWRGYGSKNPLVEYKRESFYVFERMMDQIKWDIVQRIFHMRPEDYSIDALEDIEAEKEKELDALRGVGGDTTGNKTIKRHQPKVGRNDTCPCGSGKKYKQCCGKNE